MCVGDLKLGNATRAKVTKVNVSNLDEVLLAANQSRVGITLFGAPEAQYEFYLDAVDAGFGTGITAEPTMVPIHFTMFTHGDLPTRPLSIFASQGGISLQYIEYFLPREFIDADPLVPIGQ